MREEEGKKKLKRIPQFDVLHSFARNKLTLIKCN